MGGGATGHSRHNLRAGWKHSGKNDAIRSLGARLVETGGSYDASAAVCATIAAAEGLTVIHATNHRDVLAGAGTLTLEFLEQAPELDAIVIALGGGSQAVGAIVVRDVVRDVVAPSLGVFAVQSSAARAQHDAWHDGRTRSGERADTFAEGIATGSTYDLTFDTLRSGLADFVLTTDADIAQSVRDLLRITHNLVEGADSAGLAQARGCA